MFRHGDHATVRMLGTPVTVLGPHVPDEKERARRERDGDAVDRLWATSIGVWPEDALQMAHPSCTAWKVERDPLEATGRRLRKEREEGGWMDILSPLRDPLEKMLKGIKEFDLHGHYRDGSTRRKDLVDYLFRHGYYFSLPVTEADAQALLDAAKSGEPLDRWVNLGGTPITTSAECSYCGADDLQAETNGKVIRIVGACPMPDGLPPSEWELNVPSGKLVVANDLRRLFPVMGDRNINHLLEKRATSQDYAATGMSHAFVGNTCPGVYRTRDGGYKVASRARGKRLTGICTDLWWYSMCDLDEFKRRAERFHPEKDVEAVLKGYGCTVIDVTPGVYRFRHDDEVDDDYGRKSVTYSTFARVRDPDPVTDYLAAYDAHEITAGQYAQRCVETYLSLYGAEVDYWAKKYVPWEEMDEAQRAHAWHRVADHIFCTNGNGVDWHEKGFPRERLPRAYADCPVPKGMFRRQLGWYPMSEGYAAVLDAAGITGQGGKTSRGDCQKLAPSFAELAFEALESMVSFGVMPYDDNAGRSVRRSRQVMRLALRAYRALAEKYPEQADPEYAAWVRDGDRADRWVEAFDLGPEKLPKHLKHLEAQRVLPDGTEFIEFDARKLGEGSYYFASTQGTWASRDMATRFALRDHQPGSLLDGADNGWFGNAGNSVPLYFVARVVKLGQQAHTGERIVEVAFDYGTDWMRDSGRRKAFNEIQHKAAYRAINHEEYESLRRKAEEFYESAEAAQDRPARPH